MISIVGLKTFLLALTTLVISACATGSRPNMEEITDKGKNQNCTIVMDDYGDSETICKTK